MFDQAAAILRRWSIPAWASGIADAEWGVAFPEGCDDWLVLPDGYIDLVLVTGGVPMIAGPARAESRFRFAPGVRGAGLRLAPGAAAAVLRESARALTDQLVPVNDILSRRWADDLARAQEAIDAGHEREAAARALGAFASDARVECVDAISCHAARILARDPSVEVGALCRRLAISERHLRRQFHEHVGYAPKHFARIMRFQRWLAAHEAQPQVPIALSAADAGYADQAHLARDCRELSGHPPSALLARRRVADSFKTAAS